MILHILFSVVQLPKVTKALATSFLTFLTFFVIYKDNCKR